LVRREANLDVVAEYLLGGNARATPWDSFFADVLIVPAGVTVVIGDRGTTWRTHDAFDIETDAVHRSYGSYVEAYRERFEVAVERRLRSDRPVGMFVSGGLDSSSILAVAAAQSSTELVPVNLTYPHGSPGNEERYVRELERALDLEIVRVPMKADALVSSAAEQVRVHEAPTATLGWGSRCTAWDVMRSKGGKSYLGGGWGDQMLVNQSYLVDLFDRFRWIEVCRHLAAYPYWMTDVERTFFVREFVEDMLRWHTPIPLATGIRRSRTSLLGVRNDEPWYLSELRDRATARPLAAPIGGWARTPVWPRSLKSRLQTLTARLSIPWNGMAAATEGLDDLTPFLDRDLVAFVMSVPGDIVTPDGRVRGLHRDALKGTLPELIVDRRGKGDGTALANQEVAEGIPAISRLFSDRPLSGSMQLIDQNAMMSALGRLQEHLASAHDFQEGRAIKGAVALEAWLSGFVGPTSDEER
jgi:hypothetical protein